MITVCQKGFSIMTVFQISNEFESEGSRRTWFWSAALELAALLGEADVDLQCIRVESLNSIANLTTRAKNNPSLFAKRARSASSEAVGP